MDIHMHRQAIAELDREIREMLGRIDDLKVARGWHVSKVSGGGSLDVSVAEAGGDGSDSEAALELDGLSQHEAIEKVLRKQRRPMRPAEIADQLFVNGYRSDRKRSAVLNSVYTSMKRREGTFRKMKSSTWGLRDLEYQANGAPRAQ